MEQVNNTNKTQDLEELKNNLQYYKSQKYFHLNKSDEYRKLELETERLLKKHCPHKNITKEKDSGPYPETYYYCNDCKIYL
jgi:hypothetical protein